MTCRPYILLGETGALDNLQDTPQNIWSRE